MRPRANTISHVGGGSVGMMANPNNAPAKPPTHGHSHHPSLTSIPFSSLNLSMGSEGHHPATGLTRLNTTGISMDMSESLRTAPAFGSHDSSHGFGDLVLNGTTINPAQLHFNESPNVFAETPASTLPLQYSGMPTSNNTHRVPEEENGYDHDFWSFPLDVGMPLHNESAIDGSSPSAMSTTGSQSGMSETMLDGSNAMTSAGHWSGPMTSHAQSLPTQINMDFSSSMFHEMYAPDAVSPKSLVGQGEMADVAIYNLPLQNQTMGTAVPGAESMFSHSTSATATVPAAHIDPFGQNSYFALQPQPEYLSSINDATRQALMTTLRQPVGLNHRRFSQPSSNPSVTSPGAFSRSSSFFDTNSYTLPSTPDLQRYIAAYVNFFHPHLPFLHIPTLNFSAPEFFSNNNNNNNNKKTKGGFGGLSNISGGGGCLILSMAAIGALFEFDTTTSKDLFDCAKKMIQLYLEERRKADVSAALYRSDSGRDGAGQNTPLWLVQAMLLNVIYGHHCDDKTSAEIASTHCAALVSLARAAELTVPHSTESASPNLMDFTSPNGDVKMDDFDTWAESLSAREKKDWLHWKDVEERKRTLYAIFMLSSLLVSAYNHAPALTNSEIRLTLPCDEQLWSAESPQIWTALGGASDMEEHSVKFSDALKVLLMASQQSQPNQFGLSVDTLRPSAFGCMVLISALHNYIWETRQQHMGKQWTNQETEAMHIHIEPALRAWQTVWSSNPQHRVERPNPYNIGPLSADCIPLLDLAYIRLFVNLGRTKEAFWQRDWDGMTDELSKAAEVVPNATGSPTAPQNPSDAGTATQDAKAGFSFTPTAEHAPRSLARLSKNERHLRKAAFYAADSLCMSDKFGNTYVQTTSRELPIQNAMCIFDCAQVLAEWAATIQDRVGLYLGILGQSPMDVNQVSAMMLLEEEDCALIRKIEEFLSSMEAKMKDNIAQFGSAGPEAYNSPPSMVQGGYSTKVLFAAAYLLSRAGVWKGRSPENPAYVPDLTVHTVTKLCSQALEHEGVRMRERAQRSVPPVVS